MVSVTLRVTLDKLAAGTGITRVRVTAAASPEQGGSSSNTHPSRSTTLEAAHRLKTRSTAAPNLEQAALSTYRDIIRPAYATPARSTAKIQCRKGNLDRDGDWWPAAIARHLRGRSRKTSPDTSSGQGPPTAASLALTELATPQRSL
jgi:hypothetical protein